MTETKDNNLPCLNIYNTAIIYLYLYYIIYRYYIILYYNLYL